MGRDGPRHTGLLGLTTKHIYFADRKKKSRVRYDRIVSFDPDPLPEMRPVPAQGPAGTARGGAGRTPAKGRILHPVMVAPVRPMHQPGHRSAGNAWSPAGIYGSNDLRRLA